LGNFVFDQPQSEETKEGLAIKIYFAKNGINKISFFPVVMENLAQPRMANKNEADKILKRLNFSLANQNIYSWNNSNNNFEKEQGDNLQQYFQNDGIISKQ